MSTPCAAVFVDGRVKLRCPRGHAVRSFHTASLPEGTYVLHDGRLYRAEAPARVPSTERKPELWRAEAKGVVPERRFELREVGGSLAVLLHGSCEACEAHVGFRLTFRPGEPVHVERTSCCCAPSAN